MSDMTLYKRRNKYYHSLAEDSSYIEEFVYLRESVFIVHYVPQYGGPEMVISYCDTMEEACLRLQEISI